MFQFFGNIPFKEYCSNSNIVVYFFIIIQVIDKEVVNDPCKDLIQNPSFHYRYKQFQIIKVAEHSFQGPMPNSPLLLNYLWVDARFRQESKG